jgi:hypothetical protein
LRAATALSALLTEAATAVKAGVVDEAVDLVVLLMLPLVFVAGGLVMLAGFEVLTGIEVLAGILVGFEALVGVLVLSEVGGLPPGRNVLVGELLEEPPGKMGSNG